MDHGISWQGVRLGKDGANETVTVFDIVAFVWILYTRRDAAFVLYGPFRSLFSVIAILRKDLLLAWTYPIYEVRRQMIPAATQPHYTSRVLGAVSFFFSSSLQ